MPTTLNDSYRRIILTEVGATFYERQTSLQTDQVPDPDTFKNIHGMEEYGYYSVIPLENPLAPSEVRRCAFRLILQRLHEVGYDVPKHSAELEEKIDNCHQLILMLRLDGKVEFLHFLNSNVLDKIFKN